MTSSTTTNVQQTYIIVRPPISSSKNPLNLQIQLVIRRDKGPRPTETSSGGVRPELGPSEPSSSMTSEALNELGPSVDNALQASQDPATEVTPELSDSLGDRAEGGLARTNSWKSTGSYSTYNSSLNGRRTRVEPMFNLAVHSVVHPTSVYDAATDFKVARVSHQFVRASQMLKPFSFSSEASRSLALVTLNPQKSGYNPLRHRRRHTLMVVKTLC